MHSSFHMNHTHVRASEIRRLTNPISKHFDNKKSPSQLRNAWFLEHQQASTASPSSWLVNLTPQVKSTVKKPLLNRYFGGGGVRYEGVGWPAITPITPRDTQDDSAAFVKCGDGIAWDLLLVRCMITPQCHPPKMNACPVKKGGPVNNRQCSSSSKRYFSGTMFFFWGLNMCTVYYSTHYETSRKQPDFEQRRLI